MSRSSSIRRLVVGAPGSELRSSEIGDAYLRKGNAPQAVSEFETAGNRVRRILSRTPCSPRLADAGKDSDAERVYREPLVLQPENALVKNNLAYLLADKGGILMTRSASPKRHPANTRAMLRSPTLWPTST